MKFWRRLRYYGIGLGIGLLLVFFIFNGRGCSWLPGNRVLSDVADSHILISEKARCQLSCLEIKDIEIYELFSDGNGDVLFDESLPRHEPKMYMVESPDESYKVKVIRMDTVSIIRKVISAEGECLCAEENDEAYTVFKIPVEKVLKSLFYDEEREVKYDQKTKCQMKCLGLSTDDLTEFLEGSKLVDSETEPNRIPNPLFVLENDIDGKTYRLYVEDAGSRTRIVSVMSPEESCPCD